jgi:pimeloyl-ACP methyl ester carboxylesterase
MANPTIVLVHGAFADASGFRGLYDQLLGEDVTVVAPPNPLRGLSGGDGEYIKAVIDEIDGPVLLVGHSYGGSVITAAGTADNVVGLVYISGFAPDEGENLTDLQSKFPAPGRTPTAPASARLGSKQVSSSRPGTAPRLSHGTSTAASPAASLPRRSRRSLCTAPARPAARCWLPSTCTLATRCRSFGTARSPSPWRSTTRHPRPPLARASASSHSGSTRTRSFVGSDCCTLLLLRHEAQCYIARAAGRDERRYLWI